MVQRADKILLRGCALGLSSSASVPCLAGDIVDQHVCGVCVCVCACVRARACACASRMRRGGAHLFCKRCDLMVQDHSNRRAEISGLVQTLPAALESWLVYYWLVSSPGVDLIQRNLPEHGTVRQSQYERHVASARANCPLAAELCAPGTAAGAPAAP